MMSTTLQPVANCPTCGTTLVEIDRDGAEWECRHCSNVHNITEVVQYT